MPQAQYPKSDQAPKSKPVHTVTRYNIRASIWKNEHDGMVRYNTTFNRSYKVGDNWVKTASFAGKDLPHLEKVVSLAESWIFQNSSKTTVEQDFDATDSQPAGQY